MQHIITTRRFSIHVRQCNFLDLFVKHKEFPTSCKPPAMLILNNSPYLYYRHLFCINRLFQSPPLRKKCNVLFRACSLIKCIVIILYAKKNDRKGVPNCRMAWPSKCKTKRHKSLRFCHNSRMLKQKVELISLSFLCNFQWGAAFKDRRWSD